MKSGIENSRKSLDLTSLFSSDSIVQPSKKDTFERLIWTEDRRLDLDRQFEQVRRYTEHKWNEEAEKDWEALVPKLGTGERHDLLRAFVEKYDSVSISVQYTNPDTSQRTKRQVALNIPRVGEARQELAYQKVFYEERLVPAGGFLMGCTDKECLKEEIPAHSVRLTKSFYIMRGEVTQALYELVLEDNPSGHIGPQYPVATYRPIW